MSRHDSAGWQTAVPLDELNTPMNEGAQAVSANGKLLFLPSAITRKDWGAVTSGYRNAKRESGLLR